MNLMTVSKMINIMHVDKMTYSCIQIIFVNI